jgi:hypothetical protein
LKIRINERDVYPALRRSEYQGNCIDRANRFARAMAYTVRRSDKMRLLPDHAEHLMRTLLRTSRYAVGATDTESMVDLRMQCWRLDQAFLGRGAQGIEPGCLLVGMPFYVPGENPDDRERVQQNLNNLSQCPTRRQAA